MMFSHTTIRFSYGPRGPGFGKLASIISARSVMLQSVGLMPAAGRREALQRLVLLHVSIPDRVQRDHVHELAAINKFSGFQRAEASSAIKTTTPSGIF
jgi:hypothetical protein